MANKLFLVCTTLALCFLLINASSYRTIVEFDEDDDAPNPSDPFRLPKCRKEFQQEQHLQACQRWMRKKARQSRVDGPPLDDDEFQNRRPILSQCCSELRQEDTDCVCPTLRNAAIAVDLQGQHRPYETRQIYTSAKFLPYICDIPQVGICPFRSPHY